MRAALALVLALAAPAAAAPDELASGTVIFARGAELVQSDARGRDEHVIAQLPKQPVRALRTDEGGTTLLADLGGKWYWMALGGTGKLVELGCGDGPAQLSQDGGIVLCRDPKSATGSVVIGIKSGKTIPITIPTPGARVITKHARKLVWLEKTGVWSAPLADLRQKTKVAPEVPLRSFIVSPDGERAFGVYSDYLYQGARKKVPAELLMAFKLDGTAARRKAIQGGVPIDWSHDNGYVLVQDGSAACLIRATGGQYKCWKGYTAVSVAPDASYALVLGNRDGSKQPEKPPGNAQEDTEDNDDDDVPVPLPTGPLALYAARLAGPYSLAPKLVTKVVDGAAVWLPKP